MAREGAPIAPIMMFAKPVDLIDDVSLDDERKMLILRQWQHDAVKTVNPCEDAIRGPILAGIRDAMIELAKKKRSPHGMKPGG